MASGHKTTKFMAKDNPEKINANFKGKHILSSDQFSLKDIHIIFKTTLKMKKLALEKGGADLLNNKIITALFYEPSSRTFGSFIAAAQRLGGGILPIQNMMYSSVKKGETLEDTARVFESYSDILVVRHPEIGSVEKMADVVKIPVINAGDGIGEHPTQALTDLFTIYEKFKKVDNLHIAFLGELAHYRPVNSLAKLLSLHPKISISFVSPKDVRLNSKVKTFLLNKNVQIKETENLDEVIKDADILYVTRVKKEFMSEELYKKIQGKYIVDKNTLSKMKEKSIIMHCLPRVGEISTEIDTDPRAVYLESQVKNGMYVRMALLALVLGKI